MDYERLIIEYPHVKIIEDPTMPKGLGGIYIDKRIYINKLKNSYEKHGILAEELGHYETTYGDITDLNLVQNQKLELVARRWGYEKVVSLEKLIECYELRKITLEDVCVHIEITADYLKKSIDYYVDKYGLKKVYKGYEITFDPLNIKPLDIKKF